MQCVLPSVCASHCVLAPDLCVNITRFFAVGGGGGNAFRTSPLPFLGLFCASIRRTRKIEPTSNIGVTCEPLSILRIVVPIS